MNLFIYNEHTCRAGEQFQYDEMIYTPDDFKNSDDLTEYTEEDIPIMKEVLKRSNNLYDIRTAKTVLEFFK